MRLKREKSNEDNSSSFFFIFSFSRVFFKTSLLFGNSDEQNLKLETSGWPLAMKLAICVDQFWFLKVYNCTLSVQWGCDILGILIHLYYNF
jgi:hypothetical protein